MRNSSLYLSLSLSFLALTACGTAAEGQNAGECADGADNDGNGAFDCDDAGCSGSPDCEGGDDTATSQNAAPSGAAIAITPATPGDDDDLTCSIVTEATDPNGDTVTYRYAWMVNGGDAGVSGQTVSAAQTSGGESWTCTVTPNDGVLDGTAASASVTIAQGNRAPSAPTVSINPAEPTDDDVLTCVIDTESVDPDGDAVTYTYAWSVDGADTGVTSATVSPSATESGEQWTCTVTASDGDLENASASASVEIAGSACAAWDVDEVGDYVMTSDGVVPTAWSSATWEGWFRVDGDGNSPCYAEGVALNTLLDTVLNTGDTGAAGAATGMKLWATSTTLTATFHTGGKSFISLPSTMSSTGVWHHVAVTFDGSTGGGVLYVDGREADAADTGKTVLTTNDRLAVGAQTPCESCGSCQSEAAFFNGAVDWIRVSDVVRYSGSFTPPYSVSVDGDTVMLWEFDAASSAAVSDLAGGDQNGMIYGGQVLEECAP